MRLTKQLVIRFLMLTGITVGAAYLTWSYIQSRNAEMLHEEKCRSLYKMKAVAVVAKEYFKKKGAFPTAINIADLRECAKTDGVHYLNDELEKPIGNWLDYGNAPNEQVAIDEGRHLRAGHIYYCLIRADRSATGFRLIGKDSQGNLLNVHGHNPLILSDSNFP